MSTVVSTSVGTPIGPVLNIVVGTIVRCKLIVAGT